MDNDAAVYAVFLAVIANGLVIKGESPNSVAENAPKYAKLLMNTWMKGNTREP